MLQGPTLSRYPNSNCIEAGAATQMKILERLACAAVILVLLFLPVDTARAVDAKLFNAFEQGTMDAIDELAEPLENEFRVYQRAWSVTYHHRKENESHDHTAEMRDAGCKLAMRIQLARFAERGSAYKLVGPESFAKVLRAKEITLSVADKYLERVRSCDDLSEQDIHLYANYAMFLLAARWELKKERSELLQKSSEVVWSTTFSVELSPLPLKLELIDGSLKVKLTRSIGPLKFDLQSGPRLSKIEDPSGLKHLVLKLPDRTYRSFNVEGLILLFDLPASRIELVGNKLTIDCSVDCLAAFSVE